MDLWKKSSFFVTFNFEIKNMFWINVLKLAFNNRKKSIKFIITSSMVCLHIFFHFVHLTFQPVVVVHDVMCPSNPKKKKSFTSDYAAISKHEYRSLFFLYHHYHELPLSSTSSREWTSKRDEGRQKGIWMP